MTENDIRTTTTTDLSSMQETSVASVQLDSPLDSQETTWDSPDFSKWMGYYKKNPQLNQSIKQLATWTAGKGWKAENTATEVLLKRITGWGEDSFQSIMENMIIMKKINGDAFAEIIRSKKGTLINLKPLNPSSIRIVVNKQGLISRYEELNSQRKTKRTFQPQDIFHICNDRVGDEIHGESVVAVCEPVILRIEEASADYQRILHRSTIRVLYVDDDDIAVLQQLATQYKDAIEKGEVLILPGKKTDMELENVNVPNLQPFLDWIRYQENFFYQAVGVPRTMASPEGATEASSKVGFLIFEPVYTKEQTLLEGDLWNQLGMKVTFNRPPSLQDNVQTDEAKNTSQTGFQPNDVQAGVGE